MQDLNLRHSNKYFCNTVQPSGEQGVRESHTVSTKLNQVVEWKHPLYATVQWSDKISFQAPHDKNCPKIAHKLMAELEPEVFTHLGGRQRLQALKHFFSPYDEAHMGCKQLLNHSRLIFSTHYDAAFLCIVDCFWMSPVVANAKNTLWMQALSGPYYYIEHCLPKG